MFYDFKNLDIKNLELKITKIIQENKQKIDRISKINIQEITWENFVEKIELLNNKLIDWTMLCHLTSVADSLEIRQTEKKLIPKIVEYYSFLEQNKNLYLRYKHLYDNAKLTNTQKRMLVLIIRDLELTGVNLPNDDKTKLTEINKKLSNLSSKFSNNVLDSTNSWTKLVTDINELKGLPQDVINTMKKQAKDLGKNGYLINLKHDNYYPIMAYSQNRVLREEIYKQNAQRSSELVNDKKFDNSKIILSIMQLRQQKAEILGFNNYAEYSTADKMVGKPAVAIKFSKNVAHYAKKKAINELSEIKEYATKIDDITFENWDLNFYSEKLKKEKFNLDQEEIRQYFQLDNVLKGMFEITNKLFGLSFIKINLNNTWHDDVFVYKVFKDEDVLGYIYFDLFSSSKKQSGAWLNNVISRNLIQDNLQLPVCFLHCNYLKSIENLLYYHEVETLFHEFGHALHHICSKVNYSYVGDSVEWDAIELPSQIMENWARHEQSISYIAQHYKTKEALPKEMINKIIKANKFGAGLSNIRQLEFGLFDLSLHTKNKFNENTIFQTLQEVRNTYSVIKYPSFDRFANNFSHIFAGGYAAGYYSYKYADMLVADAFCYFKETGDIFNQEVSQKFFNNILSTGSTKPMQEQYLNFRGQEPNFKNLLIENSIID